MFGYDSFKAKMQRNSEEKVQNAVYASWYGNTFYIILATILITYLIAFIFVQIGISKSAFVALFIFIIIFVSLYIGTRKAGIALSENRLTYVKFKHIGYAEKEVFEVPFEKIKSLTILKILNMRFGKISFIANNGKFVTVKFIFSSTIFGPGSREFRTNGEEIYKRLVQMQKVIDRGDF